MASYEKALKRILRWEGGYVDNPADSGGATNKGITLTTYRHYYGVGKTKQDLLNIKDEEVEYIYKVGYWNKIKGDQIQNQSLAELIFDFVVNSGIGKIKSIQGELGLKADGIIGPVTLDKLNHYAEDSFKKIYAYRFRFYGLIATGKNSVFYKGWMRRLTSYKFIAE